MSFHKRMTIRHQCTLKPNLDEKEMKITPLGMEHVKHKRLSIHNSVNFVIETQFNGCFGRNIIICWQYLYFKAVLILPLRFHWTKERAQTSQAHKHTPSIAQHNRFDYTCILNIHIQCHHPIHIIMPIQSKIKTAEKKGSRQNQKKRALNLVWAHLFWISFIHRCW